jgi:hypothetical protein
MAAVGVAVTVAESASDLLWLHPNDESSSWLAAKLKESFELTDDEAEKTVAVLMGRPNFLKTTGMVRSRRERHPAQWEAMAKKIAAVFVEEEDVDATAATVEENMSKWRDSDISRCSCNYQSC